MVAAKADGKAKIAAQLQMRPMPIQRVVCEFLLTDFYDGDGDGDDGDDDDGNDADDDVEEEEVCENLGASGVMIALYLSRVIASRVNTEALTCDLMYSEQWWTVDLDFSVLLTVTQLVNMLILQKIEPNIQWPSLIVMNLGK